VCVRACVRACVPCVRACVRACTRLYCMCGSARACAVIRLHKAQARPQVPCCRERCREREKERETSNARGMAAPIACSTARLSFLRLAHGNTHSHRGIKGCMLHGREDRAAQWRGEGVAHTRMRARAVRSLSARSRRGLTRGGKPGHHSARGLTCPAGGAGWLAHSVRAICTDPWAA